MIDAFMLLLTKVWKFCELSNITSMLTMGWESYAFTLYGNSSKEIHQIPTKVRGKGSRNIGSSKLDTTCSQNSFRVVK